jgi:hypothetical protein
MSTLKFKHEKFDPERAQGGRLFSDGLEEDPWVIYHGTAASNSRAIEQHGFIYVDGRLSAASVANIIGVFRAMNWSGSGVDGFVVLASFTNDDFSMNGKSPTFFADNGVRSLLFATRDFAGGEKLRSVRRALDELKGYISDDSVRADHMETQRCTFEYLSQRGAAESEIVLARPKSVDLDWLTEKVKSFQSLYKLASLPLDTFTGGVVYAVRMQDSDLPSLCNHPTMGIKAWKPLPPDRIVCRMEIPHEVDSNALQYSNDIDLLIRKWGSTVFAKFGKEPKAPGN